MKGFYILIAAVLLMMMISSCNSIKTGIGGKKTLHERYRERLEKAGFDQSPFGRKWIMEADKSLSQPVSIDIPYKQKGYFAADKPMAFGYRFNAKRGEKLLVNITTNPATGTSLFADLYESKADGQHSLLVSMDTTTKLISYELDKDATLILRLQAELLWGIEYSFTITTAPSLAFPVRKDDDPKVASFWGADRDAGARSHEGIDIFAKKLTPAIAAADGYITRVNENTLGGKVVFLRPDGKDISLYYAHLDSQLVSSGQRVKTGDIVGLIGNTGNARTTPAHLHFGIYTNGGAVDPYPFVNVNRKPAPDIIANDKMLNEYVRTVNSASLQLSPSGATTRKSVAGDVMRVTGVTGKYYQVRFPNDETAFVNANDITAKPLRELTLINERRLTDQPDSASAAIRLLSAGTKVLIKGSYKDYYYARYNDEEGWIIK